ncbi:MAG: hypothetical protein H5U29_04835 [Pusillimonas sp.]|nr:hypothetical protein [Pusillimonas sp.]
MWPQPRQHLQSDEKLETESAPSLSRQNRIIPCKETQNQTKKRCNLKQSVAPRKSGNREKKVSLLRHTLNASLKTLMFDMDSEHDKAFAYRLLLFPQPYFSDAFLLAFPNQTL